VFDLIGPHVLRAPGHVHDHPRAVVTRRGRHSAHGGVQNIGHIRALSIATVRDSLFILYFIFSFLSSSSSLCYLSFFSKFSSSLTARV
jgi:hypothetical protein